MLFKHKILNGIWLIEQSFANNYLPYITHFLNSPLLVREDRAPEPFLHIYKNGRESEDHINSIREAPEGSIAVIDIAGAITKHDQECGPDGMLSKSEVLRSTFSTPNISGVILRIDSGGGEGMAMRGFVEAMHERNKPVVAFIDDMACSAAYGIASAADHVVANSELATVGSIGTYLTIADYTKYYENQGIKLTDVYAEASTDKNKPYLEALKGNFKPVQELANSFNDYFLDLIQTNRGDKLSADRKKWGTGRTWQASEALDLGLVDEINTFSNVLNSFV